MLKLEYKIKPDHSLFEQIKKDIILKLNFDSKDFVHDIEMALCELVENSIKYCPTENLNNDIEIQISLTNFSVKISVSNYYIDNDDFKTVINTIDKIKNSANSKNLYIERINEIIKQKNHGKSQMGLYRIAFEGECTLDYKIKKDILTIYVEKKI